MHETLARKYKVNISGLAGQLPTLILFEDSAECLRFPPIDTKTGKYGTVIDYKEKELVRFFDLDKRYLATRDIGANVGTKKKAAT